MSWRLLLELSLRRMRPALPGVVSSAACARVFAALRAPFASGSCAYVETRKAMSQVALTSSTPRFGRFFES